MTSSANMDDRSKGVRPVERRRRVLATADSRTSTSRRATMRSAWTFIFRTPGSAGGDLDLGVDPGLTVTRRRRKPTSSSSSARAARGDSSSLRWRQGSGAVAGRGFEGALPPGACYLSRSRVGSGARDRRRAHGESMAIELEIEALGGSVTKRAVSARARAAVLGPPLLEPGSAPPQPLSTPIERARDVQCFPFVSPERVPGVS